ncbi:hypothetical protein [Maribacter sp. 2307ULW6-5]|uniref:hypothetical protein n=1 Tax=Maribacter sp. 2307ULW6-5 TaxID=3386275 RepID=UPI0039BD6148
MKKEDLILDSFGEKVILNAYDDNLKYFKNVLKGTTKWGVDKEYSAVFQKLNTKDRKLILDFYKKQWETAIFSFLSIFEENEQFRIIYQENGKQVNLVEISEMLKAEPLGDQGWIARFSKEVKDDEMI